MEGIKSLSYKYIQTLKQKMRIVIAGGLGFLGTKLTHYWRNHHVIILTRSQHNNLPVPLPKHVQIISWDGENPGAWCEQLNALPKIDAVINLCGSSIGGTGFIPKMWSEQTKKTIYDSRIKSSKALNVWLAQTKRPPKVFIQQSGIDYYPCNTEEAVTENSQPGDSFLAKLAQDWEKCIEIPAKSKTRLIITRTAPIFHPKRPPLLQWLWSTYFYGGATIGSSEQYISWLHHDDFAPIIDKLIQSKKAKGAYNLCAPAPIQYIDMMKIVGEVYKRPIWLYVPGCFVRAALGEASTLALDSREVIPEKLLDEKFDFQYPHFQAAMLDFSGDKTNAT